MTILLLLLLLLFDTDFFVDFGFRSREKETIMSQVLPYEENISRYGNDGDEEKMSLTCRLHNTNNFFSSTQNKRPPKLGQIGRSKRGERTLKSFSEALAV